MRIFFKKLFKQKRKLFILSIVILIFIVFIVSTTYTFFTYNKNVVVANISTGSINITYSENVPNLNILNALPMSDAEGMVSTNYMDFSVVGTVDTEPIYYELDIVPKSGNTFNPSNIKVYLTDQNNNAITNATFYSNLNASTKVSNSKVLVKNVFSVTSGVHTVTRDYRLRMWIDDEYLETSEKTFAFDIKLYAQNENY